MTSEDSFYITGGEKMAALGAELKTLGAGGRVLKLEMQAGLRAGASPLPQAVRAEAYATLPKTGALNLWIANAKYAVRTSLSARTAGVAIVGTKTGGRKGSHDLEAMDEGTFRHPVYGNASRWVPEDVTPGFFTRPLERAAPFVEAALSKVLTATVERIGTLK